MEFKGTKGKWVFDDINMVIKGEGIIEGMTVIANVSPRMNYTRGMTTQCANAQLIAAAPEMLNKLNEFLVMFSEYDMRPEDELHEYADSVRKLLDKALGYPDGKTD